MKSTKFEDELIKLGKRLKQLRKFRNLKLLELEVLSGINDSDISRYEQGKENMEFLTIYKLAKALDVEISVLTDYDGGLPNNLPIGGIFPKKIKKKNNKSNKLQ